MTRQVLSDSPLRFSMAYSIDSFSEYSSVAVNRTPTRAIVPPSTSVAFNTRLDEELFRDLFGPEADAEQREIVPEIVSPRSIKKIKSTTPNKPITWSTGSTLSAPFGPINTPVQPRSSRRNQVPTPSLSLPVPRQDAIEPLTARPPVADDKEETVDSTGLSCVPEVEEEIEDDDRERQTGKWRGSKSSRHVIEPVSPGLTLKKHSPTSIQQDTLKFLEKLDLKTLLAQPRPSVTTFLPANNQFSHTFHDSRVEEDNGKRGDPRDVSSISVPLKSALKAPGRRDVLKPLPENTSRLAHVAETYGTTAAWPRKARKETLERLSNPISGHTSTLRALSPESRRKRESELCEWTPTKVPAPKTLSSKKTKNLIDRLTEAPNVYAAAAAAPRIGKKNSLVKGESLTAGTTHSNPENAIRSLGGDRKYGQASRRNQRKTMLKEKLAARGAISIEQPRLGTSTFLTQHEEDEAQLISSARRRPVRQPLVPQRLSDVKRPRDLVHIPQRPALPPSVRTRYSSSSKSPTKRAAASTPAKRGTSRVSNPKAKTEIVESKARQTTTTIGSARTTQQSTRMKSIKPKAAISSLSASRQVLGTVPAPTKSTASKPNVSRRKTTNVDLYDTASTPQFSAKVNLPQIHKPSSSPAKRNLAPVSRRFRNLRPAE